MTQLSRSSVGQQIKLAMQENHVSIERLAEALGVSKQRVYSITKAKDLRLSTFLKICDVVGVSPNQLLEK